MRATLPRFLLISCLFFVFCAFVTLDSLLSPFEKEKKSVLIEDFCGCVYGDLDFPEWMRVEVEYAYDQAADAGIVLSQSPAGGSLRKLSAEAPVCEVKLTVSLGEATVILPSLAGRGEREATDELRSLGLAVQIERSFGLYPEGEVLGSSPSAGTRLPVGGTVTLFVSAGEPSKSVKVPPLVGLSREDALVSAWLSGLRVARVIEEASPEEAGRVIRQSLQAGTLVGAGTEITLYVSAEPTV